MEEGPERFRKVQEACTKFFLQFARKSALGITSYDPKTKKVNDWKSNDYFNVSVEKKEALE